MNKREPLHRIVKSLAAHIELLRARGWDESAAFLEMARLDLLLRIHHVSERELRSLFAALGAPPRRPGDQTLRQLLGSAVDTAGSRRPPAGRAEHAVMENVRRSKGARRQAR